MNISGVVTFFVTILLVLVPSHAHSEVVTLPAGTEVSVELVENINGGLNNLGETIKLRVRDDVKIDNKTVIPKGALVKARITEIMKRGAMGKGGSVSFLPLKVVAVDRQEVVLARQTLTSQGSSATSGRTFAFGMLARGRPGFVLRGTKYELDTKRDTKINVSKPHSLPAVKKAAIQLNGKFQNTKRVKFSQGKIGDTIVLVLSNSPELANAFTTEPDNIKLVKIIDYTLHKPVTPIKVVKDADTKTIRVTFKSWDVIRYAQPGKTPITVQVKLSNGQLAQANVVLETDWKLK